MAKIRDLKVTTKTTPAELDELSQGVFPIDNVPDDSDVQGETLKLSVAQLRTLATKFDTELPDTTPVTNPLGTYTSSTTVAVLKAKTANQILQDILFQVLDAQILPGNNKSLTLAFSPSINTTQEVGINLLGLVTLQATFNQGLITNGGNLSVNGNSTTPLVGALSNFTFTGPGISSTTQVGNTLGISSGSVALGSNTWTVSAAHAAGETPYFKSDGSPSDVFNGQRGANSVPNATRSLTGIYPYFFGTSGTLPTLNSALLVGAAKQVATAGSSLTINFGGAISDKYVWFAVPSSTKYTAWVEPSSPANNGAISDDKPSDTFRFETATVNSPTSLWTGVSYDIYVTRVAVEVTSGILTFNK